MGARWRSYAVGRYRLGTLDGEAVVTWRDGDTRRRYRLGVRSEEEGRAALRQFVAAREQRLAGAATIADVVAAYIKDREIDGRGTDKQRTAWKALAGPFGRLAPADLDKAACMDYRRERLAAGRAPGTVWTELSVLRAALNWARKSKLIPEAPHVWMPPMPPPRDRRLGRDELARLIEACREPHVKLFVVLAIATAARHRAILQLTWDRVDLDRCVIDLHDPKRPATSKGRAAVPINAMARAALQAAHAGRTGPYVIEWGGRPLRSARKGFAAACRRSGIEDASPHTIRHSAACLMAEDGVPMAEIAQYLGHRNPATTARIYARYSPGHLAKAAKAVSLDLRRAV